ncbi:rhodanese-like domain-containing protein [Dellaglioa carnosa]|uniref:Rhodanese-like domain-containing protein n=1 Tax=Dellaglioa carnosa TaxID=2995136 RepID=A0ABT4JN32_9LACO|nr:rhodanese-like domain-containing protein [Dellaglioa carnosa]MCZ2491520.1 rhodanese-like domain-containing protein [Dellaglioa carnosa]MCZ2494597.1 rhodanese-like domain-containing protein [Dellaglioa carnosa]MDK1731460.1 rhodanese-like domain-containing protein [Dellaglioa carnosa]
MNFEDEIPTITTTELEALLSENPQIIDVREDYEFAEEHILNAINVPLGEIDNYELNGKAYIICRSGQRSAQAADILYEKGNNVVDVYGGMLSWQGPTVTEG